MRGWAKVIYKLYAVLNKGAEDTWILDSMGEGKRGGVVVLWEPKTVSPGLTISQKPAQECTNGWLVISRTEDKSLKVRTLYHCAIILSISSAFNLAAAFVVPSNQYKAMHLFWDIHQDFTHTRERRRSTTVYRKLIFHEKILNGSCSI